MSQYNVFDRSEEYDEMLDRGLRLSGEGKSFFVTGRLGELRRQLGPGRAPRRILDFGCGIGDTSSALASAFRRAEVVGVDTARSALDHARKRHGSLRVSFHPVDSLPDHEPFDLCYANGVFHHIEPRQRLGAVRRIRRALSPGGHFAFFENNPWNPGTRLVMRRIPFDRDARMLSVLKARRLLRCGGFSRCRAIRFLFFFPRPLAALRRVEPWLSRLPLGAQYFVLAAS